MVVAKFHARSLASMGRAAVHEYAELIEAVRGRGGPWEEGLLEAEHGGTTAGAAGSCIDHTHVHLIPGLGNLWTGLDGQLPVIREVRDIAGIATLTRPYIFLRNGQDLRAYDATRATGQLVRRMVCQALARDDWDWALFPALDRVGETVALWNTAIGTHAS